MSYPSFLSDALNCMLRQDPLPRRKVLMEPAIQPLFFLRNDQKLPQSKNYRPAAPPGPRPLERPRGQPHRQRPFAKGAGQRPAPIASRSRAAGTAPRPAPPAAGDVPGFGRPQPLRPAGPRRQLQKSLGRDKALAGGTSGARGARPGLPLLYRGGNSRTTERLQTSDICEQR